MFLEFLFFIVLIILSISDWRRQTINSLWLIGPAFLGMLTHQTPLIWIFLIYVSLLTLNTYTQQRWLGHGDLDVLATGACCLSPHQWLLWLTLSCCCQLLLSCRSPQTPLPFVPSLSCGFMLQYIL